MASEKSKRDTIFPGSHQWIDGFGVTVNKEKESLGLSQRNERRAGSRSNDDPEEPLRVQSSTAILREQQQAVSKPPMHRLTTRQTSAHPSTVLPKSLPATLKSPWVPYEKLYALQLGVSEYVTVAERRSDLRNDVSLVMIQQLVGPEARNQINFIQSIDHPRLVKHREVFRSGTAHFIAFDFMPLSLSELAGSPLVNEIQLASIMGQVSIHYYSDLAKLTVR